MKKLWNSFKIAFSMYSRLPAGKVLWSEESMPYTMICFPWIGGVIGLLTLGVFFVGERVCAQGMQGGRLFFTVVLVLIPIVVTGGIHLDGFLDVQDALGSYRPREKRLEILKDSHVGAFAVISGLVYILACLGVYSALTEESVKAVAVSFMVSRSLSALSVLCFPMAKKDGFVATFSQNAEKRIGKTVLCIYLVLLCALDVLAGGACGAASLAAAAAVFFYYYRMSRAKFGGITGDLAGYFLQLCELWMAAAAVAADMVMKAGVGS